MKQTVPANHALLKGRLEIPNTTYYVAGLIIYENYLYKGLLMSREQSNNKQIVLVEDDADLASLISDFLQQYNFDIVTISDGVKAAEQIIVLQPDLVILDIMLPGMSGMDVCKKIRSDYSGFILMQTALDDDIDQMMGLEFGADDYVVKQVQPRLLLSRINALLRRAERGKPRHDSSSEGGFEHYGPLSISLNSRRVTLNQVVVELTTAEFDLLVLLAASVGRAVSRDEMIQSLRGYEYDGLDRSIDRRISRLRRKLQLDNGEELIKTVRGVGYQLCIYSR
jgi:two-component system OmpR family response regulator/two-component system response regulator RstA